MDDVAMLLVTQQDRDSYLEENNLINRLRKGDNAAFKIIVNDFQQKVIATCYGYTGDYEAAVDLAQDVFVEIYKSISKFREEAKLSTWIYRIATNKSLNWVRDNKKHKAVKSIERFFIGEKERNLEIEDKQSRDGYARLITSYEGIKIQKAIDKLPDNQKIAFVLNKVDDLSYKQVAEIMDISLSAVESLIHRARKKLQKELISIYSA
jgi:RNA polymerase sigma-70 factor (ECF subfamily)